MYDFWFGAQTDRRTDRQTDRQTDGRTKVKNTQGHMLNTHAKKFWPPPTLVVTRTTTICFPVLRGKHNKQKHLKQISKPYAQKPDSYLVHDK